MKILINLSTLRVGGGLQVGLNILKYCLSDNSPIKFYYLINKHIDKELDINSECKFVVEEYPSKFLNFKNHKNILNYVNKIEPNIIYSVGSPSYLKFRQLEVQRLTNPWIIYKNQIAYKKLSWLSRIRLKNEILIKKFFLKRCDYFITQTSDAKINISKNLNKKTKNIFVIPNVYSFNLEKYKDLDIKRDYSHEIRVLVFSANYSHKNLDLCIKVAKKMKLKNMNNIKFIMTLPSNDWEIFNQEIQKGCVSEFFENKGKVMLSGISSLFIDSHLLFLPTLLEVFSVTFLEAMIFKLPIITTNLSFNNEVCKSAALYFEDLLEGEDVLDLISEIIKEKELREKLVHEGNLIIKNYRSNSDIYSEHIEILKNIYENK